jgi:hypothetical protein
MELDLPERKPAFVFYYSASNWTAVMKHNYWSECAASWYLAEDCAKSSLNFLSFAGASALRREF